MTADNATALRFAGFYGAFFLALGVLLPYWPVYLAERGLGEAQIGLLLGAATWVRVALSPAVGHWVDRSANPTLLVAAVATAGWLGFAAFGVVGAFWAFLLLQVLGQSSLQCVMPLADSRAMAHANRGRIDYGRVRLWGSLAFIGGVLGGGWVVEHLGAPRIYWLVIVFLAVTVAATLFVPAAPRPSDEPRARLGALLRRKPFLLFLLISALIQASHAVYYGFSALHWTKAGLSGELIGWLWAEGVVAEILLFWLGARLIGRLGPGGLILLAALGGVARWSVLALTSDPLILAGAQVLHALTFGATHLAAMHFISREAPGGLAATAQSIYASATMGLGMGSMMLLSGWAYEALAGRAFFLMALSCLLALGLLPLLFRPQRVP